MPAGLPPASPATHPLDRTLSIVTTSTGIINKQLGRGFFLNPKWTNRMPQLSPELEQWQDGPTWDRRMESYGWRRVKMAATDCPRLSPEFLAIERAQIGQRWFQQEYETVFAELICGLFRQEDIDRAFAGQKRGGVGRGLVTVAGMVARRTRALA
jgi:hypothetical protein